MSERGECRARYARCIRTPRASRSASAGSRSALPRAEQVAVVSNAKRRASRAKERGAAAIASRRPRRCMACELVARNIEDEPNNTTRFLVLGSHDAGPSGHDKTSLDPGDAQRPRRDARPAHAARAQRRQHDAARIAARAHGPVGIRVLRRHRRATAAMTNVRARWRELERKASLFKNLGSYPGGASELNDQHAAIMHDLATRSDVHPVDRAVSARQADLRARARDGARRVEHRQARVERESARREPARAGTRSAPCFADLSRYPDGNGFELKQALEPPLRRRRRRDRSRQRLERRARSCRARVPHAAGRSGVCAARVRGVSARDPGDRRARASKCRRATTGTISTRWRAPSRRERASCSSPTRTIRPARSCGGRARGCSRRAAGARARRARRGVQRIPAARACGRIRVAWLRNVTRISSSRARSRKCTGSRACAWATRSLRPTSPTS